MRESRHVFNPHRKSASYTEHTRRVVNPSPPLRDAVKQPRQLLSCTKCRERKVKCDRCKPCAACCARGVPKECFFVAEDGDYAPIQQSYEIRKLRADNLRLKERLRAFGIPIEENETDPATSPDSYLGDRTTGAAHRRRTARQKRFQGSGWSDSIYFGSPSLASIVSDFAVNSVSPGLSLAHLMPHAPEIHTTKCPPPHPFPTLFKATPEECIPELLECLPATDELLGYLGFFEKRVHVCAFPQVPIEITQSEVERFLSDAKTHAQMCPDMLALLFAALALGAQYSTWDRCGGEWKAKIIETESQKANVYIAAAFQALRMASYMHKPTLLGIQALIMIGPYLTNSGRFLDAWTLFGTTIRLAHSVGLHRNPKYLDPEPDTSRECALRQSIWWWMLHMDQEYSMTLGRPLGISGIGDCPPPHQLTTNPQMVRFGDFVNHFTIIGRQILSSDRLSNTKIDEFTDMLKGLWDTMPEPLQFDESWADKDVEIPEWPLGIMAAVFYCKTHSYVILLNRQRVDKKPARSFPQQTTLTGKAPTPPYQSQYLSASSQSSPIGSPKASLRGRALVLSSSEDLLIAFLFFHARVPAALITWTVCQQAFNCCMILILDAMETRNLSRIEKVEKAYVVFLKLDEHGVHELAEMAVERLSWGLAELGRMNNGSDTYTKDCALMSPKSGAPGCDIQMHGTTENEATRGLGATVMGNTGMMLLEDSGLQSFIAEAYAPFDWNMGRTLSEDTHSLLMQDQDEQEQERFLDDVKFVWKDDSGQNTRSSERIQNLQGSVPRSAQSVTFPTSPPTSGAFLQEPRPQQHDLPGGLVGAHHQPPPHLRHHSSLSLRQAPQPMTSYPQATSGRQETQDGSVTGLVPGERAQTFKQEGLEDDFHAADLTQMMPQFPASQPMLPVSSHYLATSAAASQSILPTNSANVYSSWTNRPCLPLSASEPALTIPNSRQAIPTYTSQNPLLTWNGTLFRFSSASTEPTVAPVGPREHTSTGIWR